MKTLGKEELTERIDEILRLVKEKGETFRGNGAWRGRCTYRTCE